MDINNYYSGGGEKMGKEPVEVNRRKKGKRKTKGKRWP